MDPKHSKKTHHSRSRCVRIQNIPHGTTREELKQDYFDPRDHSDIFVRSIAPAPDRSAVNGTYGCLTATVTWDGHHELRSLRNNVSIDEDFHGFTPLNTPREPIAAESVPTHLSLDSTDIQYSVLLLLLDWQVTLLARGRTHLITCGCETTFQRIYQMLGS